VDDVDAMTLSAARLGAVVMTEPYDLPIGRQSVIIDPGGAVFAMLGPRHHARRCHLSTIV
jgi:predicted enzyme related to lactoylglutathione lyase